MNDLISFLSAFGITPARYPFGFIAILVISGFLYLRFSLGRTLSKIKDNVLVIVTHLTTSSRGKLDPTLIKQMSPLQIQPDGEKVLAESGFIDLFNQASNQVRFFSIIDSKNPTTKLDVETYAIYAFLELMGSDGLLNPVRVYLYQHPDIRETFPTLAGVYIRDKYLSEHEEISQ